LGTKYLTNVQTALYAKLTGDATLMALITGVYDDVPTGTALPYVVFGEWTDESDDTMGANHRELTFVLEVHSEYLGFKESLNIADEVKRVLHKCSLTVTGATFVGCLYQESFPQRPPGGRLRFIPMRFRLRISE